MLNSTETNINPCYCNVGFVTSSFYKHHSMEANLANLSGILPSLPIILRNTANLTSIDLSYIRGVTTLSRTRSLALISQVTQYHSLKSVWSNIQWFFTFELSRHLYKHDGTSTKPFFFKVAFLKIKAYWRAKKTVLNAKWRVTNTMISIHTTNHIQKKNLK